MQYLWMRDELFPDYDMCRSFSDDQTTDSVDTEKSRIILHELERGWWILAVRGLFGNCHVGLFQLS